MSSRWLLLLTSLAVCTGYAAELRDIKVEHEKGVYTMRSEVWFDAGIDQVFDVFKSWEYSTEFSSAIVEARDVEPDETGQPGYYSKMKGCVLFFCKSFVRQGYVELEHNVAVRAVVNPDTSDFELANEAWTFREEDGGTVVVYDLKMQPKFWIPPAIGPYFIKRKLKKDGGRAIDRIEAIARALPHE